MILGFAGFIAECRRNNVSGDQDKRDNNEEEEDDDHTDIYNWR
jgi:hypothetical protein